MYEDCRETLSRRPSHESVVSVYEDCQQGEDDDTSEALTVADLMPVKPDKEKNKNDRRSKESVVSVYEDATEYLETSATEEYEDSLMVSPSRHYTSADSDDEKQDTAKKRENRGFQRDVLFESYEVIEQVTEEVVVEEVMVTETKILSDSYEVTTDVDVEVMKSTDTRHHEQVVKQTFVHVDGSPHRFFPGVGSEEKKFFPPLHAAEIEEAQHLYRRDEVVEELEKEVVETRSDTRRETVVVESGHSRRNVPRVYGSKKLPGVKTPELEASPGLNTQSPTRLLAPQHVRNEHSRNSFSPLQNKTFSPQSPKSDPNADPNESRRETVTMECPSPALVACHSRLVRAGYPGCVDEVDLRTPLSRLRDQYKASPKSSTPVPGRGLQAVIEGVGSAQTGPGPSWLQHHLEGIPCSPVAKLDTSPLSPRKTLFSTSNSGMSDQSGRFSTQTVTKIKPALAEITSPIFTRSELSPPINTETVTKSRSSIGHFMKDEAPKTFNRTVDDSSAIEQNDELNTQVCGNMRRRSLTVTKSAPSGNVRTTTIPECTDIMHQIPESLPVDAAQPNSAFPSCLLQMDSRTRSGSGKKRRSSGGRIRKSSGAAARVVESKTVVKSRCSTTPPLPAGGRRRYSSKKLFSPQPQGITDVSIQPLTSPSPCQEAVSEKGMLKLAARAKQGQDTSLEFPVHQSKVTANLVKKCSRRSGDDSRNTSQNQSSTKVDQGKKQKRRSFGNKTLPMNANRPAAKCGSPSMSRDGASSLRLTRTQQLRRNGLSKTSGSLISSFPHCRKRRNKTIEKKKKPWFIILI